MLVDAVWRAHDPLERFASAVSASVGTRGDSTDGNLTAECLPDGQVCLTVTAGRGKYPVAMSRDAARSLAGWLNRAAG